MGLGRVSKLADVTRFEPPPHFTVLPHPAVSHVLCSVQYVDTKRTRTYFVQSKDYVPVLLSHSFPFSCLDIIGKVVPVID
jgi:hypothetical protein